MVQLTVTANIFSVFSNLVTYVTPNAETHPEGILIVGNDSTELEISKKLIESPQKVRCMVPKSEFFKLVFII